MTGCVKHFADLDRNVQGSVKSATSPRWRSAASSPSCSWPRSVSTSCSMGSTTSQPSETPSSTSASSTRVARGWRLTEGVLRIWDRHSHLLAKVNRGRNRLYMLHMEVARPLCLATRKLGHEQMVRGMPQIDHVEQLCDTCVVTKLKQRHFPRQVVYHA
jgi:hypothetical protein